MARPGIAIRPRVASAWSIRSAGGSPRPSLASTLESTTVADSLARAQPPSRVGSMAAGVRRATRRIARCAGSLNLIVAVSSRHPDSHITVSFTAPLVSLAVAVRLATTSTIRPSARNGSSPTCIGRPAVIDPPPGSRSCRSAGSNMNRSVEPIGGSLPSLPVIRASTELPSEREALPATTRRPMASGDDQPGNPTSTV